MRQRIPGIVTAAVAAAGITWIQFSSTLYPYTISQPSSFRHVVLRDNGSGRPGDYFYPVLGSTTTNLSVYAYPGRTALNQEDMLRMHGGEHVRRIGWLHLAGMRVPLVHADFRGLTGRWSVDQVSFVARGLVWVITTSCDPRYLSIHPTMMHMMRSFRLRS